MSLIIAGERSGVGKTTITLSILAFLAQQKNCLVQSFKVGPDYIDPMFHTAITGRSARNLDPLLTSPDYVRSCFALHSKLADYAVIEGVMGLFDGVSHNSIADYASTAQIARLLEIPVLLVLDCSRLSGSVAAIAHGFRSLDPRITIAGVVLNRVASDRHLKLLQEALNRIEMPILGVIRRHSAITIPDRHLGLIPTPELPEITKVFARLAEIAKNSFNWEKLLPLLKSDRHQQQRTNNREQTLREVRVPLLGARSFADYKFRRVAPLTSLQDTASISDGANAPASRRDFEPIGSVGRTSTNNQKIRIAVARDRAFNFYYQDNLDILERLGAEICFWSPLQNRNIPDGVKGFYFGGGFPEVFAEELAANQPVKQQLKQIVSQKVPIYAECGGLMYLCDRLVDFQGKSWQMVGTIPTTAIMSSRLTLGYRQAFPLNQSSLIAKAMSSIDRSAPSSNAIWGHEFHRSQLERISHKPLWQLKGCSPDSKKIAEGWAIDNIHASYLHLHFGESQFLLKKWLGYCQDRKN